jgi:hypothetical protein
MTTTETSKAASKPANGTPQAKRTRTTKAITAKSVGLKMALLVEKLPKQSDRDRALQVFASLIDPAPEP